MSERLIGLDFDNTIADYDAAFPLVAREMGLLPKDVSGGKRAVKDWVRAHHGDEAWMRLQGQVYGPRIAEARPYHGLGDALDALRASGHSVVVVSHKTEYGHFDASRTHLHDAARHWLAAHDVLERAGMTADDLYFETVRAAKIARIAELRPHAFVDDLAEVLEDPAWPEAVERHWFAPGVQNKHGRFAAVHDGWAAIAAHFSADQAR